MQLKTKSKNPEALDRIERRKSGRKIFTFVEKLMIHSQFEMLKDAFGRIREQSVRVGKSQGVDQQTDMMTRRDKKIDGMQEAPTDVNTIN